MSKDKIDISFALGLFEPVIGYFSTVTVREVIVTELRKALITKSSAVY